MYRKWFAVLLAIMISALVGCADGGGGGKDDDVETGTIVIHWPFSDDEALQSCPNCFLSPDVEANVGSIRVSVFETGGTAVVIGAQGEVTATTQTATIIVPVGTGYEVHALAIAINPIPTVGGPEILGSGGVTTISVVADTPTVVTITLGDATPDLTATPSPGTNFAFGETPVVTFDATGIPANLAPIGAQIFVVEASFPITLFNVAVCTVSSGTTCTVGAPGLGDNFGFAYTSPLDFIFRTTIDASDYAMPSTDATQSGTPTLWPQSSIEDATTNVEVTSSVTYTADPSGTGSINVDFN